MQYKKIIVKNEERKVLFFAKKKENFFDLISIEVLGAKDFSYWQVEVPISHFKNEDINSDEFNDEVYEKLYNSNEYQMDGCSCRGDKKILNDLKEFIPEINKTVKETLL